MATGLEEQVFAKIDRDRLVKLTCDMVDFWSPTGQEEPVARFMYDYFQRMGLYSKLQEVEPGRANAVGTHRGTGGGVHLMFNGHLDTSYTGKEEYLPPLPSYQPKAYIEEGWIYGLGAYNMKSGVACYVEALNAVRDAGITLKGDVTVTAVAGEVEKGPVDRYQGAGYRGGASGSWYLCTHGGVADMCVIAEPTTLKLLRGHGGYHWTRINVLGTPGHTVYSEWTINAILKARKVMDAILEWAPKYKETHVFGKKAGNVTISAIEGGWPYRGSRNPIYCTLYVDARVLPGQDPTEVEREIAAILNRLRAEDPDLKVEMDVYMSQTGSEVFEDAPVFQAVARAHKTVFGTEVDVITETYFTDATEFNRKGIPTLNYGPAGFVKTRATDSPTWDPSVGEHVRIEDMYQCAKVYAALILDVCSKNREEVLGKP